MEERLQNQNFKEILAALLDNSRPFPARFLHSFSDISKEDLESLKKIWKQVDKQRRITLTADLEELLEADTILCFDDLALFLINDDEPDVRSNAIRLLWESEDIHLVPILIHLLQNDPSELVRAAAASGLGKFVFLGELDEISPSLQNEIEDNLMAVLNTSSSQEVQRKALEALGYSSREEMKDLIRKAFEHKNSRWVASALFAMGRSADRQWENQISEMIDHPDDDIRIEAIRAAGELELVSLREKLIEKATNLEEIWDARVAAIWSLSQLGGEEARETLENLLENTEDDDEMDILEDALDNIAFTDDQHIFGMNL